MIKRTLILGVVVAAMLVPTAAFAGDGERGGDRAAAQAARVDAAEAVSRTAGDHRVESIETDAVPDRSRDERDCDGSESRAAECEHDERRRCAAATDRRTDCPEESDGPTVRSFLKRCLWHHVGERPILHGMTIEELRHLLQRCLWHHGHHWPPV